MGLEVQWRKKGLIRSRESIDVGYALLGNSSDRMPYLEVKIFEVKIKGLLDSGANRTLLGRQD